MLDKGIGMLQLTKIDKSPIIVNLETIKFVESVPDTLITFMNGDTLMVLEKMQDIVTKTIELQSLIVHGQQHKVKN